MSYITATQAGRISARATVALAALLLAAATLWTPRAPAQDATIEPLTQEELEILVGPIALYPDEVLAVVLPASTYPLEVVQAARFLEDRQSDPSLQPSEDWDDSIVALLNYPDVVRLLNDDLDWTWDLGEAVLDDQSAVLDAIQAFRDRAYDSGNLVSDDRQVVTESGGVIAIAPADPEVVYIPYYEPAAVVVYQPRRIVRYYPYAYPLYYYPYPIGYHFSTGFFWGVTSAFVIGWDTHFIHLHHHTHYLHPYYRRSYYTPYYARNSINVTVNINNYRDVWRPRYVRGARPYDGVRAVRRGDSIYRTYDGRRYRTTEGQALAQRTQRADVRSERRAPASASVPRQGTRRAADAGIGGLRQGTIDRARERNGNRLPQPQNRSGATAATGGSVSERRSNFGGVAGSSTTRPTNSASRGDGRSAQTRPANRAPVARSTPTRPLSPQSAAPRAPMARSTPGMASSPVPTRTVPNRTVPSRTVPSRTVPASPGRTADAGRIAARPVPQRAAPPSAIPQSRSGSVRQAPPVQRSAPRAAPQARAPAPSGGGRVGGVASSTRSGGNSGSSNRAARSAGGRGQGPGAPRGER